MLYIKLLYNLNIGIGTFLNFFGRHFKRLVNTVCRFCTIIGVNNQGINEFLGGACKLT
ncbi:hypothetical protein D3C81_1341670 [compost metagenome]